MGTRMRVEVQAPLGRDPAKISETVFRAVEGMENLLSTWKTDSPLSRANTSPPGVPTPVPSLLGRLLEETLLWSHRTLGAFDPTIGSLVDTWDLRGEGRVPTQAELLEARAASGRDRFHLLRTPPPPSDLPLPDHYSLARSSWTGWLDSGGFGKGAALRKTARDLQKEGAEARILLDLGGQIWAQGPWDRPWEISVADPRDRHRPLVGLSLQNVSVATSGQSERWVEFHGGRAGHILDPRTGRPAPAWGSVTVVSPDPLVADILATALFVMGPEEGSAWVAKRADVGALFLEITEEGVRATWNRAMEGWLVTPPNPVAITQPTRPILKIQPGRFPHE